MALQQCPADTILCGPNFTPWKARIKNVLKATGLTTVVKTTAIHPSHGFEQCDSRSALCARMMCAQIAPRLLSQINDENKQNHADLLRSLESLCVRFRFLDLPPELRNKVYEYCRPVVLSASQPQSLLSISRQVRSEVLPLFYSRCKFLLDFTRSTRCDAGLPRTPDADETADPLSCLEKTMVERMSSESIRLIKHFDLALLVSRSRLGGKYIPQSGRRIVVSLTVDEHQGLKVSSPRLRPESVSKLVAHVKEIEKVRKMLNLRGEAIIMVFTLNAELWKYGTLRCP